MLDNPTMIGVGIDAATAVVLHGDRLEVVGRRAVVVFDARRASVQPNEPGEPVAGTGVVTSVLREGMTFSLRNR